ncbi:hypothetical protein OD90_0066 [Dokdonia sp. Hel_I_53]|nr:hypothetical protein OD90_0066 [Dokdonia sp. Hel_I_53]
MKSKTHTSSSREHKKGRNIVLAIYVILSTFFITSYTLVQYFSM